MSSQIWRWTILGLCAVSCALLTYGAFSSATLAGYTGIDTVFPTGVPFVNRVHVLPGSPAYKAGLRSGDLVNIRALSPVERLRWIDGETYAGQPLTLAVQRGQRQHGQRWLDVTVRPSLVVPNLQAWISYAGKLWMLLFCGVLAWRRPDSPDAMILTSALAAWTFMFALYPDAPLPLDALRFVLGNLAILLFRTLPVVYVMRIARRVAWLRTLAWLAYAAAFIAFLYQCSNLGVYSGWFDSFVLERSAVLQVLLNGTLCPLLSSLCLIGGVAATERTQRARVAWVALALPPFYLANFVVYVLINNGFAGAPVAAMNDVIDLTTFAMPVILTYSLLSRRLLDVGFILNRAAVFSAVSIVLVGTFVLVEWILTEWMSRASHTTNVLVSAAVALGLGLSVRFVHTRIDRVVDTVFFRKRHEDEQALRTFALEAPYITNEALLLHRAAQVLERHADASFARIMLDDGRGAYDGVDENDSALLRLRATHRALDLHGVESEIAGEMAYPMVARGRLVGVLVLGPRKSGERYAADESDAIAQLAISVGVAVDVFSKDSQGHTDLLEAIRSLPEAIAQYLIQSRAV